LSRYLGRITAVLGAFLEVTLKQANALSILDIDCGNDVHAAHFRKFPSSRDPAADERSG